jgi:non-ribosomal peptide synthetase component F
MSALGVHRVVERQAVARGDQIAIIGPDGHLTYRELNQRANVVARHLMACGLRRGSRVIANMERSPQLAVVLLAVLKAGAAYMWIEGGGGGRWPDGVSISRRSGGMDQTLIVIDRASLVQVPSRPTPNLPIVTRSSDIACVLPQRNGLPAVLVPHAAITALQSQTLLHPSLWAGEAAALDLWVPLMAGATVLVAAPALHTTAA